MVLAAIESNPLILKFILIALGIVIIGLFLRMLKQTHVIIYIITGVIIGPSVTGLVSEGELITSLGSLGLILLLFFIGMEISLPKLVANWRIPVIGTVLQIILSVLIVWIIGVYYDWSIAMILTLGFVISLSSTAVIVKLLQDSGEINNPVGQNVLGVLLVQDILIVPMLMIMSYLSGTPTTTEDIILQVIGGLLIIGLIAFLLVKKSVKLPFHDLIKKDHEIQLFFAFGLCFGFAALTAFFGLSTALGAFIAGILVASSKTTEWFHDSLYSLKVIFVALFFVSIGMLIDVAFLWENAFLISTLVLVIFVTNNIINTLIMRSFKISWGESIYSGAMLSQVGEFSFILGNLAYFNNVITDFGYQLIISIISISLLISPIWIKIMTRMHTEVSRRKGNSKFSE